MKTFIVLPTQVFKSCKHLDEYDTVYLVEDPYYINNKFHKQKLVVYIAALRYYEEYLSKKLKHVTIKYVTYDKPFKIPKNSFMYDPIDYKLINKYKQCTFLDSPLFMETMDDLKDYHKANPKLGHSSFYKWQRTRLNILMDNDKPLYDKWSFDTENRKKFPSDYKEAPIKTYNNKYIQSAKEYVATHFKNNFGLMDNIYYPTTHAQATTHFNSFISNKLNNFGATQDAISSKVVYGEHSNISVLLNTGLLDVRYVVQTVLNHFNSSKNKKQIIASVEGYLRQIFWRSYVHFVYRFYRKDLINANYFNCTKRIDKSWYDGTTDLPILNHMIKKVKTYAYNHHIERLMINGNIALLYELDPKEVYKWFMAVYIDSADWVMWPNIQMSQHMSNDVKMMGRIYICSDNYIKKMSDFTKEDLDGISSLYHKFLKKHKNKLKHDYVLASQLKN